ncbi:putative mitochondrial protein [Dendrobium catenatum]|uniref:Putative mitochondrial protein n=1 Tax=Dendrobium catenatum TaxID=906689 RepID=A0A2I0W061_9ASPA|nr:putative mitochondrial protein [Dendrobium catenatum]
MGFVKGRAIANNIWLAKEFYQDLDVRVRGRNFILNMDIDKAYKNIDWNSIYNILHLFGFNSVFIKLIKNCIKNVYFFIIVNGYSNGFFKSSHGLRQGDPILPVLFIIIVEFLSKGITNLFENTPSLYFRMLGGFPISHLCFANNFIVFTNAYVNRIHKLMNFFDQFEMVSGLSLNKNKCYFVTSKRVPNDHVLAIKDLTGFMHGQLPMKYLGVAIFKGHKKTFLFYDLITSIQNKFLS